MLIIKNHNKIFSYKHKSNNVIFPAGLSKLAHQNVYCELIVRKLLILVVPFVNTRANTKLNTLGLVGAIVITGGRVIVYCCLFKREKPELFVLTMHSIQQYTYTLTMINNCYSFHCWIIINYSYFYHN